MTLTSIAIIAATTSTTTTSTYRSNMFIIPITTTPTTTAAATNTTTTTTLTAPLSIDDTINPSLLLLPEIVTFPQVKMTQMSSLRSRKTVL